MKEPIDTIPLFFFKRENNPIVLFHSTPHYLPFEAVWSGIIFLIFLFSFGAVSAQQIAPEKFVHQEQSNYYKNLNLKTEAQYDSLYRAENLNVPTTPVNRAANCNLNYGVYGWHPYWVSTSAYNNYNYSLLSTFAYFSYELVPSTGKYSTIHSWRTTNSINLAQAAGTRVDLTVTNFGSTNNTTFLTNATAQQTLIDSLISLLNYRNADGVNIDFEGVPGSQRNNLTLFMQNLSGQLKAAISGATVSIALYSVDWNSVFDIPALDLVVDQFIIMGYGYYYSGSSKAGPTGPLYSGTNWTSRNVIRSVNYYLNQGITRKKLLLGLPYYGYEWETTSTATPGSTTGNFSSSRTYSYIRNNSTGNYSTKKFNWENFTPYYIYPKNGAFRQAWVDDQFSLGKRLDMIKQKGIGGMGMWALGYDNGYTEFWDLIRDKFTTCEVTPCTDTIYDMGGPKGTYYDNENYEFTISPTGASSLTMNFLQFDLEAGFDSLWLYNGTSSSATLIGGYSGTTSPNVVTANSGSLTLKFHSDGATKKAGWKAYYNCSADATPPTTQITANSWESTNFNVSFTDADTQSGVKNKYYSVSDFDGTNWSSNTNFGFLTDKFNSTLSANWTITTGVWNSTNGALNQTDEAQGNSNINIPLAQSNTNSYVYHWRANMGGAGTNRRSGIHFFADNAALPNRGNSYFVYYRVDNNKCQIYKVINDAWTLLTNDAVALSPNVWYDYKISYNPISGKINAYANDVLVSSFTDSSPLISGNAFSFRSGNTTVMYDDINVYKSRVNTEMVTVGTPNDEVRFQNLGFANSSCKISSLVIDSANNWSNVAEQLINIDWTAPQVGLISDGLSTDIDTTFSNTTLSANWGVATEPNSTVTECFYTIGTSPNDSNIVGWTSVGTATSFTNSTLNLFNGAIYYISVRCKNTVNLTSLSSTSDGILYLNLGAPTVSSNQIYCNNQTLAPMTASANIGGILKWYADAALTTLLASNATSFVPFNTVGTTVYYVVEDSNGQLSPTSQISITINAAPTANAGLDATICNGKTTTLTATGGGTYLWSNNLGTNAVQNVSPTATTQYTVTVTNNLNCSATDFTIVTINSVPIINTSSVVVTNASCGGSDGSITGITATGTGLTYLWKNAGLNAVGTTADLTNISTGIYNLTVNNMNNCTAIAGSFSINQAGATAAPTAVSPMPICNGTTLPTLIASGSGGTLIWYSNAALTNILTTGINYIVSNNTTTSYFVTETNGSCESVATQVNVVVNANPTASAGANVSICNGNATQLSASGGVTYLWDNGLGTMQNPSVNPTTTTTYNVTTTDVNNCSATAFVTVSITNSPTVIITASATTICEGTQTILTASGATNYMWDNGLNTNAAQTVSPISSTVFSVTGTDANGCTSTNTLVITVNPNATASFTAVTPTVYLPDSTITFVNNSTNATSYFWDFGDSNTSNLTNPVHAYSDTGKYTITLFAVSGSCGNDALVITDYVQVLDTSLFPISNFLFDVTNLCVTDSFQLIDNSQNALNYNWSATNGTDNFNSNLSNPKFNLTVSGSYTFTLIVANFNGADTLVKTIFINISNFPTANFSAVSNVVFMPTATASFINNSTDATSYFWGFGNGNFSTTQNPTNAYATTGFYDVSLVASNGICPNDTLLLTNFIEVQSLPNPISSFTLQNTVACIGDSLQITNISQFGSSYQWTVSGGNVSNPNAFEPMVNFTTSGIYQFNLTTTNSVGNDISTQNISITIQPNPIASFAVSDSIFYISQSVAGFTNNSQNATASLWDFGDLTSSTNENPWHAYQDTGIYQITLIVGNSCSVDTFYQQITVLDIPSGIVNNLVNNKIQMYPNPTKQYINLVLNFNTNSYSQINILNLLGDKVFATKTNKSTYQINLKQLNLPFGTYFIKITNQNNIHSKRFIFVK